MGETMDKYAIVVVPLSAEDGGGFASYVPDLPGCMSDGETQEEAISNARDAIACWMEANADLGREAPEPGSSVERNRAREKAFIEAMRAALDYADQQGATIKKLERDVEILLRLMQDDRGGTSARFALEADRKRLPNACH